MGLFRICLVFLPRILDVPWTGSILEPLRPRGCECAFSPRGAWKGSLQRGGSAPRPPRHLPQGPGGPLGDVRWQCPGLRGPCVQGPDVGWLGAQSRSPAPGQTNQ